MSEPSIKQKNYAKNMADMAVNGGNSEFKTKYDCAIMAGYSESVANSPKAKIENTDSFQKILVDAGVQDKCMTVLDKGLDAQRAIVVSDGKDMGSHVEMVEDQMTQHKYMVSGFQLVNKLKGGSEDVTKIQGQIVIGWANYDPDTLRPAPEPA